MGTVFVFATFTRKSLPACATTTMSDTESTAYNTDVAIQTAQETTGEGGDTVRK